PGLGPWAASSRSRQGWFDGRPGNSYRRWGAPSDGERPKRTHAFPPDCRLGITAPAVLGLGWRYGLVVALRGPGCPGSLSACRPGLSWQGPGLLTTCRHRGLAPWCGSKEARAPASSFWNQACRPRDPSWPRVQRRRRMTMAAVIIGVDPHKGSHTAVAIGGDEMPL